MPHVLRNPHGQIDSVHREPVPGAQWLPPDHPDLQQLLGDSPAEAGFASLDAGLIRVLEDLVDVLVARNVINITDLPAEAQHKLFARKNFRDRFQRNALQLFAAPEDLLAGAPAPAAGAGGPDLQWLAAVAASGLLAPAAGQDPARPAGDASV
ncbi:hypothetical protein [Sphaerotilus microaerophilus]|uniref:Uncharacterized protein n=1 Tax=Sphaerotilus microaerophilus TaxID=2914710 RepID=A0ABM7YEI1_9BURK|nr:hypothetical protein [Sphaerotilus sp. FB-5]BDI03132.1 hypothetical protein CATMQ487_01020 [Sphaerotilus sp. FB-5]